LLATLFCAVFAATAIAQTDNTIYSFTGSTDGASPSSSLVADSSGNYYGTTFSGGSYSGSQCQYFGCGVVFKLSPNGSGGWTETPIYTFTGLADGAGPAAGLVFDSGGNLYGTAAGGGINGNICQIFSAAGCGVVFELSPNGSGGWTEKVLYSFRGNNDGWDPQSPLTLDSSGNLYGTTSVGGPYQKCGDDGVGCGEIFKLSPNGSGGWTYTVLHFFTDGRDGARPYSGVAINAAGDIFTTAEQGGDDTGCNCGTVVELSPNGSGGYAFRVLHTFTGGNDGETPFGGLTIDSAGNIYGAAQNGAHDTAGICKINGGCGAVFKLTPSGANYHFGVIYIFHGAADGWGPDTSFAIDVSGNLYGGAYGTPSPISQTCKYGCGMIYKLTPSGSTWTESVLYAFTEGTDGGVISNTSVPTLNAAGNIVGTALEYGIPNGCSSYANGCGVVYEITP